MVWYMSCRKWKVNNIVWMWVWRNWALVGVAQWQYWDGGILAETWRKRKNQPYKVWENNVPIRGKAQHKVPEAGKSCECVQNSKKGVMAGAERVNGESEDGGQWGWGGCRGHRKEFGFYSKCKEKSLEGFKQGNNVMWFIVLKDPCPKL